MHFTDTHCHIHESEYKLEKTDVLARAEEYGVRRMICVGTDEHTSAAAVDFASKYEHVWASVGLHPHDATNGVGAIQVLEQLLDTDKEGKIIAIGECGLDYFYNHSPPDVQADLLHAQIKLALKADLPLIFHVRDAFNDFWPIFDQYEGLRGVLHSFTDDMSNLEKGLERGLYVGVNGISTFTKDPLQLKMFASVPVERLLLETDSPFLTPVPKRGKVNEPAFVTHVAQFIANLQSISLEELSRVTEQNATRLFFK